MGILGRNHSKNGRNTATTVLAAGSSLVGELALDGNLHVDGRINGSINSTAEVTIGPEGRVEGDIKAQRVLISGSFEGNIEAERLEIVATGKVTGEVVVGQLVVESGAQFNGSSRIRGDEAPRQITHDKPSTTPANNDGTSTEAVEQAEQTEDQKETGA
ncbi:MAG: polymer-forming cytoskeletal protein [Wenzhouxiangella sp.]|nr:MAG: polymer-forming cytoskeletal protein [Wenzhouxiangella sp.]